MVRADLPLRYSEGFNPHPRLSIPWPRPVGVASESETLVAEFDQPVEIDTVVSALAHQTPQGVRVTGGSRLRPGEALQPIRVEYRLDVDPDQCDDLARVVREVLRSDSLPVERAEPAKRRRSRTPGVRRFDARPFIEALRLDGHAIRFTLKIDDGRSVRPAEMAGLLGLDPAAITHRITRLAVHWRSDH